jgi:hypothetical protein
MNKRAISVTLAPENLLWLRGRTRATGHRSISDFLDRLVREARTSGTVSSAAARSVVGTVRIDENDPDLRKADAAVRAVLAASLGRRARRSRRRRVG